MLKAGSQSYFLFAVFLTVAVMLNIACETEDCVSLSTNDLWVTFYESDGSDLKNVTFFFVKALENDSIFYDKEDTRNSYALPLNPVADRTTFVFQVLDSITYDTLQLEPIEIDTIYHVRDALDTFDVHYRRAQRIITVDCGAEISYNIDTISTSTFTGFEIENRQLSRFNAVNVKVFF